MSVVYWTDTYGPMSDGVTDSEGGGGKLIRVGVVISQSWTGYLDRVEQAVGRLAADWM